MKCRWCNLEYVYGTQFISRIELLHAKVESLYIAGKKEMSKTPTLVIFEAFEQEIAFEAQYQNVFRRCWIVIQITSFEVQIKVNPYFEYISRASQRGTEIKNLCWNQQGSRLASRANLYEQPNTYISTRHLNSRCLFSKFTFKSSYNLKAPGLLVLQFTTLPSDPLVTSYNFFIIVHRLEWLWMSNRMKVICWWKGINKWW